MDPIPKALLREKLRARDAALGYCESTMRHRSSQLGRLIKYLDSCCIDFYTPEIGLSYLDNLISQNVSALSMQIAQWLVVILDELYEGGPARLSKRQVHHSMYGAMAQDAEEYIDYERNASRWSSATISCKRRILSRFTQRMSVIGIGWNSLQYDNIVEFLSSQANANVQVCATMRGFMQYAFKKGLTKKNFGEQLKSIKTHRSEKLPTYYSPEEVAKLEATVDRGNGTGKRDYAIILLATRLGLRSSDIVELEFKNLDWDRNEIRLVQQKTGRPITLPLLADVGEAIIDYIKTVRPNVGNSCKTLFLKRSHPFQKCTASTIFSMIKRYFEKAGINCKGKRQGPHALRHSLVTAMLGEGSTLPVISANLGHSSTESTMYYLGVDVSLLLKCSLEVPPVDDNFYIQKGGILYE